MTDEGSMLLTGKRALDFSGSSFRRETNLDIGGAEKIMAPNGQAQLRAKTLADAYLYASGSLQNTAIKTARSEAYPPRMASSGSCRPGYYTEEIQRFP